jgi:hypothetical protein
MQTLNKNENFVATFEKVREVLLTHEHLGLYISQDDPSQLIFENPQFAPYAYEAQGLLGKLDGKRTRYSFECVFHDLKKVSEGKVTAILIVNDRNESYFESLTINLIEPRQETIRVVETEMTYDTIEQMKAWKFNAPKLPSTGEAGPKERP